MRRTRTGGLDDDAAAVGQREHPALLDDAGVEVPVSDVRERVRVGRPGRAVVRLLHIRQRRKRILRAYLLRLPQEVVAFSQLRGQSCSKRPVAWLIAPE